MKVPWKLIIPSAIDHSSDTNFPLAKRFVPGILYLKPPAAYSPDSIYDKESYNGYSTKYKGSWYQKLRPIEKKLTDSATGQDDQRHQAVHLYYGTRTYSLMHFLLDAHTTPLNWDVREPLKTMTINRDTAEQDWTPESLRQPLTSGTPHHVRIISEVFPWTFDIRLARPVTATDVLHSLAQFLMQPLEDVLWGAADEAKRRAMAQACSDRGELPLVLRRVDWLEHNVTFKGFLRDDDYARQRLLPSAQDVAETWLAVFGQAELPPQSNSTSVW